MPSYTGLRDSEHTDAVLLGVPRLTARAVRLAAQLLLQHRTAARALSARVREGASRTNDGDRKLGFRNRGLGLVIEAPARELKK